MRQDYLVGGGRAATARSHFVSNGVKTASAGSLLVMLFDRLVLDLVRAEQAQRDGVRHVAHQNLLHAQDIVTELLNTLDTSRWDTAPTLSGIYAFLLTELVQANVTCDAARTARCRLIVEPLRDAWRQAAAAVAA